MAQRYGGEHSPKGDRATAGNAFRDARRSRAGGRVNLLFLLPLPLAVRAFMMPDAISLALTLVSLGLLLLAAWLTRDGLIAEDAYLARRVARRPALPRKAFGSILTGLGLFAAVFASGGLGAGAILGVVGAALHLLAFGPDPMRDKGMEGIDTFQQDRVALVVDEAEKHLASMRDAALGARDRAVMDRLDRFQATARDMCRIVERDPRDLTAARKFLGVYLMGARDATIKFADIFQRSGDEAAKRDYMALLDDLESKFTARSEALLLDDKTDLDVEIEVLRDRLAREGVKANRD